MDSIIESAGIAQRQGRLLDAETLYKSALEDDPGSFRVVVQLSVLARIRQDLAEAKQFAGRAIELRPTAMEGHLQLGLCLLAETDFEGAANSFSAAIAIKPDLAPLHHNLGLCLENLGKKEDAIAAFRNAMRLGPTDVRSRLSLGAIYLADQRIDSAYECALTSLRIDRLSAEANILMAKVLSAQKKEDQSEHYIRKALELDSRSALGHTMLGFRFLQKGAFDEAEKCFMSSIHIDPVQGAAYHGIAQSRKIVESDRKLVEHMEAIATDGWLSFDESGYLQYALSKAYDNLGEYGKAIHHCHEAHRFSFYLKGGKNLDREAYAENIDATMRLYSAELLRQEAGKGLASEIPVFIVGMMRSGTTLTEQILSSHPSVAAAGENWFWPTRAHQADNRSKMEYSPKQATSLAREYCRSLRGISPSAERVTDKLPGNYHHLGLLSLALPNAKFVHTIRNAVDTCLSIYFTPNTTAPDFSHSPEDIVFVYRQYARLMDHWRATLPPDRLMEIVYEDLIENPEPVIRKLIAFCGLEWDDACMSHEKNAKAVRTPSLWQVRQPMYKTSAGRWKCYEPWLGSFGDLLAASVVKSPTEP
jgi:tetratricopeptide (TPR) repeat protein